MSKPEWGTKRACPNCGTRYYDMRRDPIMCPKCGAPFDAESLAKTKKAARVVAPTAAEEVPLQDEELEADLAAEPDGEGESITEIPVAEEGEDETEEKAEPTTAGKSPGRGKVAEDETKKDGEEEEEVIEDASELGEDEDDMAEVIENVDEDDDR